MIVVAVIGKSLSNADAFPCSKVEKPQPAAGVVQKLFTVRQPVGGFDQVIEFLQDRADAGGNFHGL